MSKISGRTTRRRRWRRRAVGSGASQPL